VPTYLYGLALTGRAPRVPPGLTGLRDSPVRVIDCGTLSAIIADVDDAVKPTLEAVRRHDAVLRQIVQGGVTVAATRFGQTFESGDAVARDVRERAARIAQRLEDLDGCVEMRLLLAQEPADARSAERSRAPAAPAGPGRAYLEQLKADMRRTRSDLSLRPALGPVVRAEQVESLPADRGVAFAHLIERGKEAEYRAAVADHAMLAGARVVGPLPLYTFIEP